MLRKLKFKSSQIFFKKKSGSNMKLKKIKKNNKKIRLRSDSAPTSRSRSRSGFYILLNFINIRSTHKKTNNLIVNNII